MGRPLLFLSLGMFLLFGLVQISEWGRMQVVAERNNSKVVEAQALSIASSMADMAIERLREDYGDRGSINLINFLGGNGSVTMYDINSGSLPASSGLTSLNQYQVLLVCEGEYQNVDRNIEVLLTIPAFSKYAYFTNEELMTSGQQIYFFDNDVINGPTHTNGTFYMSGTPTFNGEVTSVNDWNGSGYNGDRRDSDQPVFNKGFEILPGSIELPGQAHMNVLENEGITGGRQYDMDIALQFNDDGTVTVSERFSEDNLQFLETVEISSFNGVISSSERIYMQGTLDGQVTVHASKDITITGDLKYKDNPLTTTSDDILGIVGERDVIIDEDAHRAEGSADLQLDATIMALGESFRVEKYSEQSRGTLHLLGGIVQQRRGPVGTTSGMGYAKDYNYDERLRKIYPPFYPRASRFDIVYWNE